MLGKSGDLSTTFKIINLFKVRQKLRQYTEIEYNKNFSILL
jgi:hypothetical protein